MGTQIIIISGFLGAGKTTLIQKLLHENLAGEKIALVENDFGEISIDAALLKNGGVQVREINSGCICCSLSGDFVAALEELLRDYRPDRVIIEPSGVGKLSDIVTILADSRIRPLVQSLRRITVVDVKRCGMYLDNFGEFFEDQIESAETVVLSRVEAYSNRVGAAQDIIRGINPKAQVLARGWADLDGAALLRVAAEEGQGDTHAAEHDHVGHDHAGEDHDHHDADEFFDTVTLHAGRALSREELRMCLSRLERSAGGTVLRAKGILPAPDGYWNVQYLPGDLLVSPCDSSGDALCVIGRNLNTRELQSLLDAH